MKETSDTLCVRKQVLKKLPRIKRAGESGGGIMLRQNIKLTCLILQSVLWG